MGNVDQVDLPEQVTASLTEVAEAAKASLLALSVEVALPVVEEMIHAEVTQHLVGPRGKHNPDRSINRHGEEPRQVTLGAHRMVISKPRVRSTTAEEVEYPATGPLLAGTYLPRPPWSECWRA